MAEVSPAVFYVDVSGAMTSRALHELLAKELRFPSYYGHNWDAFDECMGDDLPRPAIVRVRGFAVLRKHLPRDADLLLNSLTYAKSEGGLIVEVI